MLQPIFGNGDKIMEIIESDHNASTVSTSLELLKKAWTYTEARSMAAT